MITSWLKLTVSLLIIISLAACAASRNDEDDSYTEEEKQQKELDDIEALLGISTEDSEQQKQPQKQQPKQQSEQLNLLGSNEMVDKSQSEKMDEAEKKKYEDKIANLERQLRQKEQTIADLNAKVTLAEQSPKQPSYSGGGFSTVSDISMEEYDRRYDEARMAFEDRNYEQAIQMFQSMLSVSSSHKLADNAQYWIGESHYALRQYDTAILDFEKVFTFANSNKADDAQFKLGLCYIRKGDKAKARAELERLLANYPDSEYKSRAEKLLTEL